MIHVSYPRLRLEPLEDRSLLSATLDPVPVAVPSSMSADHSPIPTTANPDHPAEGTSEQSDQEAQEYATDGQTAGQPNEIGTLSTEPGESGSESGEYPTERPGDKHPATRHRPTTPEGDSTEEYNSGEYSMKYLEYPNSYYPVIEIPPPPAPTAPLPSAIGPIAPESRTDPNDDKSVLPLTSFKQPMPPSPPAPLAPISTMPAVPDVMPEMPPDPPRADEQGPAVIPSEVPLDDISQPTVQDSVSLLDELTVRLNVGDLERAATQLLDGLDRVLLDGIDSDSPLVRLGYWFGAAAALGIAIELTRHGLRARRSSLDLRTTITLPVKR